MTLTKATKIMTTITPAAAEAATAAGGGGAGAGAAGDAVSAAACKGEIVKVLEKFLYVITVAQNNCQILHVKYNLGRFVLDTYNFIFIQ